jgi:hypothetical protein
MGSLPHPHQEDPEGRPLPSVTPFFFATLPSFIDAWNSSPGSHVYLFGEAAKSPTGSAGQA